MKQVDKTEKQKKISSRHRELREKVRKTGQSSLSTEERREFRKSYPSTPNES